MTVRVSLVPPSRAMPMAHVGAVGTTVKRVTIERTHIFIILCTATPARRRPRIHPQATNTEPRVALLELVPPPILRRLLVH